MTSDAVNQPPPQATQQLQPVQPPQPPQRPLTRQEQRQRKALMKFAALVFRTLRRSTRRLDQLNVQVQSLTDRVDELVADLRDVAQAAAEARRQGFEAKALYYDQSDSLDVLDLESATSIEPRSLPDARTRSIAVCGTTVYAGTTHTCPVCESWTGRHAQPESSNGVGS